jgi:hypothetical protein
MCLHTAILLRICVPRTIGRQGGARIYYSSTILLCMCFAHTSGRQHRKMSVVLVFYCTAILLRLCVAHTSGRQDREMSAVLAAYREMVAREEARAKELRSAN